MKRLLFLSLIFCGLSFSTLLAQTTAIPDTAFEAKLIQLGIDTDSSINGQVLTADVVNVTYLNVSGTYNLLGNIQDLTGIEDFLNLQTLECNYNSLSNLDISTNTNLRWLSCSYNNLLNLNTNGNNSLEHLDCKDNNLSSLNLSTNIALQYLRCSSNNLSTLNVSTNTALLQFECRDNNLSTLDISTNIDLEIIDCANNNLSSLIVQINTALEWINCTNNNLSSLDVATNIALQDLYCYGNNLSSLDISTNTALLHLYSHDNNLSSLDVSTNTALEAISCNNNSISSLDINSNINLQSIDCSNNNLSSLDVSTNIALRGLTCNNNNLSSLDLNTNIDLRGLTCNNNNLSILDISTNTHLRYLFCANNNLSSLNLSINIALQDFTCSYNNLSTLDLSNNTKLRSHYCNNNQLTHLNLQNGNNNLLTAMNAYSNAPNLIICIDDAYQNPPSTWYKDFTANYSDICQINLEGILAHDSNINCLVDSTEQPLPYHIIEATNLQTGLKKYTNSKTFGRYGLGLDTGSYIIAPIPKNSYWATCIPAQTITIDTSTIVDTLNLPIQETISCPLLTVSLSAPFLRATGGGSNYTIHYCNDGTAEAPNPYIEVRIDTGLNVLSTSIPYSNQNGNLYTFPIDTLTIGECGNFTITVIANPNLPNGQTLCSKAHIYPDSICLPIWNDAIIEASATCQIDTIAFKLSNVGSNMLMAQNYTIFEDDIIVRLDSFTLNGGDSIIIKQVSLPNKIYRIEAQQALGFPSALGAPIAHATVMDCNGISSNLGILPQFYTGNSSPFIDTDCQQLIASYDPNDKQAQPEGYGINHYLLPNLPIDYKVRFQNTGNDTAFLVVVVDTLSPYLDISSIQMGVSSHPYTWELKSSGILVVSFEDIKLVDSTTNEPLSNGFFTYSIQQQPDLPTGTIINNQAAIYFDYNPPILTNTAFHTIARYFYKSRSTIDSTICETDSFWLNGTLIDTSGSYIETLSGSIGQDSTIIWNISINSSPALFYSDTVCSSITINGLTYDSSGIYTQLLIDTLGCDTILTIDLTVNYNSDTSINITACDSFLFNGVTYTNSGTYTHTTSNTIGCNSLITLNLILNYSSDTSINITACDSFFFNGVTYTNSGTYTHTTSNTIGCDSLITLNLILNYSSDTSINITACDSFFFNGVTYTNSGTYTHTISNTIGCDSLITLNLLIDPIDLLLNVNGTTLISSESGASYQWLDCNNLFSPILGATNQSFTPTQNGNYAVEITKLNCSHISNCQFITVVNTNIREANKDIWVYPNPTTDKININLGQIQPSISLAIFSVDGRQIHQQIIQNQQQATVDLSTVPSGLYLLRINTGTQSYHLKLIKE